MWQVRIACSDACLGASCEILGQLVSVKAWKVLKHCGGTSGCACPEFMEEERKILHAFVCQEAWSSAEVQMFGER